MNTNETALLDPFEVTTPDEATELSALVRALELAEGFHLLFVCCNQIPQRERLMEEIRARLPKQDIQTLFFREPIPHLLDAIRAQLTMPTPDALFVSGLEFSLPDAAEAHATPLIANLNASRNSFAQTLSCPVVLWVPEYVLTAIMQGAPDFFSIRSGVYFFAAKPGEIARFARNLSAGAFWEVANLAQHEKQDRIAALERLLADYELLPDHQRDRNTERRLLEQLAAIYYAQGHYSKALTYSERALKIAEEIGNVAGVASSLHNIGAVQQDRGNYEAALDYYQRALKIKEELGNMAGVGESLNNMGRVQQAQGNDEAALDYYQRALKIKEELGDVAGTASSLHNIGIVQQAQGNDEAAFDYYQRALKVKEELGDMVGVARSLHQIGMVQQDRGNYEAALDYYQRALKIKEELGNVAGVAISRGQMGILMMETERFAEAFGLLLQALSTFIQLESPNARIAVSNLKTLRGQWGGFDAAWQEATGEDVPEWLLHEEETKR